MKEESQTVTGLAPGLVDGVAKDIMKFMDGEQIHRNLKRAVY